MKNVTNKAVLLAGTLAVSTPLYADDSSTSGTSGTSGASGVAGSTGTANDFGLNKKVIANFTDELLVIPCVEAKESQFDGFYNVVMSNTGSGGSGEDWSVVAVSVTNAENCDESNQEDVTTDELLFINGLPSIEEIRNSGASGTSGTSGTTGTSGTSGSSGSY